MPKPPSDDFVVLLKDVSEECKRRAVDANVHARMLGIAEEEYTRSGPVRALDIVKEWLDRLPVETPKPEGKADGKVG